ncbi:MAG: hypothetical protein K2M65_00320, partial [Muribaculaceae bacterium]|nr:hypothetical protein [Muribaculaceae bacterium]
AGPLAAGMLPSHYFLRQLVRFIVNRNPGTQFILPSETLRPVWQTILGDVYTDLVTLDRLLVINKGSSMRLTRDLSTNQITQLHRLLATKP